jgi:hypothetical protein
MNRRRHRACSCGGRGLIALAMAMSHIGWSIGIQGWCAQAAGDRDLVTASLVAKDYVCSKAGVNISCLEMAV